MSRAFWREAKKKGVIPFPILAVFAMRSSGAACFTGPHPEPRLAAQPPANSHLFLSCIQALYK